MQCGEPTGAIGKNRRVAIAVMPRGGDDDPRWLQVLSVVGVVAIALLFLGFAVWRIAEWLG